LIKARIENPEKGDLLVFGLSRENIDRLTADQPIKVDLTEMGLKGSILIFFKETTGDLIKTMTPYIGKDTKLHDNL
jgi:hypothetical protein